MKLKNDKYKWWDYKHTFRQVKDTIFQDNWFFELLMDTDIYI